jgi:outer membrane protein assembly factor BamB
VTDGSRIFTSGGYPKNHMSAVMADGSARLAWENQERLYVPSFLYRAGYLYAVLDAGIAGCWKADDGKEMWKARLGGTFSSSPVLVGENIYATNEAGETFVWKAEPQRFVELAKNVLGEEVFATPVFVGGRIYYRATAMEDGQRQEYLYCLAMP